MANEFACTRSQPACLDSRHKVLINKFSFFRNYFLNLMNKSKVYF